jgi:MSHA biogenesis protein MshI
MLAPLGEAATDLQQYLASNLYVPVELLNLESILGIADTPQLKSIEVQQQFFMTLGAALRLEEKVL